MTDGNSTNPMQVHTLLAAGRKQGHGDPGVLPVMVFAPAPAWLPRAGNGHPGLRRPVVAVVDTGVASHPWLAGTPGDPVVADAADLDGIARTSRVTDGPYQGHATFVAGVIRQTAPQARILSVPVMGDDGIVPHDEALRAMKFLDRRAGSGEPDQFVDVICLAYGYEPGPEDKQRLADMRKVLWSLAGRGVLIVASAGNNGDQRQEFPAAFAADPNPPAIPVTSVGATNPDRQTCAQYSSYGSWVTHWAVGSGVISTMEMFNGSQSAPPLPSGAFPDFGSTIDPDDFTAGFARWSGTSFAAAETAGLLALALSSDPSLADLSAAATIGRAVAALATIESRRTVPPA